MTGATTVAAALREAAALGLERIDAQVLLLHAAGRATHERAWLITHDTHPLPEDVAARFAQACTRRLAGEPVAYLVGMKEFHGLPLSVDPRVLVPRPDTETLVEWALERLTGLSAPAVLDLGTGSGAIALAIARARPDARVVAVDASADALAVARANAASLGLAVDLRLGDWFSAVAGETFGLVVSNPPYIAEGDAHLPALAHEPRSALVSGADGLDDIRRIVATAAPHLAPGGWLLIEHGWDQAGAVRRLLADAGLQGATSRTDLAGIERCSGAARPSLG
jgi:release factor glutamine methyltransferase